jgi:hypothetical protein
MRIPVPEMDDRFDCTEDTIEHIIRICNVIVAKAKNVYPTNSVSDIPGYVLEFCRKVLIQATTLVKVAREEEDYNTVCSLVRMLADNVATINLVYNCQDDEERVLRHLLYVLDGVTERYKYLKDRKVTNDGRIPRETFEALKRQVEGARDNAAGCMDFCDRNIKALPVYSFNKDEVDILIKNRNWKYKNIVPLSRKDKNAYTWKEMYGLLSLKKMDEMMSFFSQYVHGLSISNIATGDSDDFDAPLSFAVCLLGWLFYYLRKVYEPHIGEYTWEDIDRMVPGLLDALMDQKTISERGGKAE